MKFGSFILALSLIACEEKEESADLSGLTGDAAAGETLYSADCAACHGVDATGGSGPSLINQSEDEFAEIIPNGEGDMPAFPDYTDQDIVDVIAYIDSL